MPDGDGDRAEQRLADLEEMDKLLLRAQVLPQRALEILEQNVSRHEEWLIRHEDAVAKHDEWIAQYRRETAERERRLDERIAKLVSAIGEMARQARPGNG